MNIANTDGYKISKTTWQLTHPFFLLDFDPSLLSWLDVWEAAEQADEMLDTDSTDVPRTNLPPVGRWCQISMSGIKKLLHMHLFPMHPILHSQAICALISIATLHQQASLRKCWRMEETLAISNGGGQWTHVIPL